MRIMIETIIYISLVATIAIGAYALYDAIMHERAVHAEQAKQRMYCELVKTLMLAEFGAIVGSGKFPTERKAIWTVDNDQDRTEAR